MRKLQKICGKVKPICFGGLNLHTLYFTSN